jgi:hypothetical protein
LFDETHDSKPALVFCVHFKERKNVVKFAAPGIPARLKSATGFGEWRRF